MVDVGAGSQLHADAALAVWCNLQAVVDLFSTAGSWQLLGMV